ncbi:MAG: UPF0280 family protein [Betaproteobacteria bacterium]|jgi:hypothetical protein|nr:UPF0280 family protein [Betaproteobacteria bacterium]
MNARLGPVRIALDARRWHFQHGPIDLVLEAWGEDDAVRAGYERAWHRFEGMLEELVAELPRLRSPVGEATGATGVVARRMVAACLPFRSVFITPMAAVAGSVADEVLAAMVSAPGMSKAYVNNGGDISLHIAPKETFRVGVANDPRHAMRHGHAYALDGSFEVDAGLPVRGIATSGWRGRSWSLGIADSVTVLAGSAAAADAGATLIANAVNVDHPAVERAVARDVDDNTDLGNRLVTVGVGILPEDSLALALDQGAAVASDFVRRGLIWCALLTLQGAHRIAGGHARLLTSAS